VHADAATIICSRATTNRHCIARVAARCSGGGRKSSMRKRSPPLLLLGAHISIAGGTSKAPPRAKAIGATAMQIFTKMANRWAERVCEEEECTAFITELGETGVREACAHDSYLINLASPDPVLREKSI